MTPAELERPLTARWQMPAEWAPHRATWLAWPHNRETWPYNLQEAQQEWIELVTTIAEGEHVCVLASGDALDECRRHVGHLPQVELIDIPTNDAWIRDYGPTFVFDRPSHRRAGIDWNYNCWGEKYPPFDDDQQVAARICRHAEVELLRADIVAEGGALEINAQGDLIQTSCLQLRNNSRTPEEIERSLTHLLGARSITWLPCAELAGDDTDGHVDQVARFVNEQTIVVAVEGNPLASDSGLAQNITTLKSFETVGLPLPQPQFLFEQRLPASYLNFYICNRGVLVPQFGDPLADSAAVEILAPYFARDIIPLPSRNLSYGLGSFHCLTQQEPA